MAIINCEKCGAKLLEGAKFCSKCRHPVRQKPVVEKQVEMAGFCRECGAQLIKGAAFCSKCRNPVSGTVQKTVQNRSIVKPAAQVRSTPPQENVFSVDMNGINNAKGRGLSWLKIPLAGIISGYASYHILLHAENRTVLSVLLAVVVLVVGAIIGGIRGGNKEWEKVKKKLTQLLHCLIPLFVFFTLPAPMNVSAEGSKTYMLKDTEDCGYAIRGMGSIPISAEGGVTLTVEENGDFSICYNHLTWEFNGKQYEEGSIFLNGKFIKLDRVDDRSYEGGLYYITEYGDPRGYVDNDTDTAFSPDSCAMMHFDGYDWYLDLAYSSAAVQIRVEDDGQLYLHISLHMYDNDHSGDWQSSWTYEIVGETASPDGSVTAVVTDVSAATGTGEDSGIEIAPGIVEGSQTTEKPDTDDERDITAEGGAVAVGLAGAIGAALANKKGKKSKKARYKMYFYKDFGDSIKKGAPNVGVFARIVEVTAKGERERPDLTAQIRLSSGSHDVMVKPIGMKNGYMGAEVRVPNENSQATEGIVCAKFIGKGGSFTQNVHFRLIGEKPRIHFPNKPIPHTDPFIQVLFGDGCTYEEPFILTDFAKPVTKITAKVQRDDKRIAVSYEALEPAQNLYKLIVVNRTGGDVAPIGKFPIQVSVCITAENDTEHAEQFLFVHLYPEGIFVEIEDRLIEDDYYSFYTCKGESVDYHAPKLNPTPIRPKVAYKDSDGKVIVTIEGITVPEKLTARSEKSKIADEKFRYKIVPYQDGLWQLEPGATIPTYPSDNLIYTLDITANVGKGYEYKLPLRLIGEEMPQDALERKEEMKKLRRILEIVGLTANGRAQELMRNWDTIPTNKLYLVRNAAYVEGRDYYLQEHRDWMELSDLMDKEIAFWSTVRWLDNMAFSFVIRAYFGPTYGDIAEAIATPLYDLMIDFIGQSRMDAVWMKEDGFGVKEPTSAWEKTVEIVLQMGENYTWAVLTDGASAANLKYKAKQIGGMIAAAMALNFARTYFFDENVKGDCYKSLVKAVSGTTLNFLKGVMIYFLVGKIYSNSAKLKPLLENFVTKDPTIKNILFKQHLNYDILNNNAATADIAERLAEGAAYATSDILNSSTNSFLRWLQSVDPKSSAKLRETIEINWDENDRSSVSLTDLFSAVVSEYLIEKLGLRGLFDEEKIKKNAEKYLPKEQPYVSEEDTKKAFESYGIAAK